MKKQLREQKGKIMNKDRKATDLEQLRQDLLGACARGYTHEENSSKELDSDLIKAMVEELIPVFKAQKSQLIEEVRKIIGKPDLCPASDGAKEGCSYCKSLPTNKLIIKQLKKLSLLEGEIK